MSEILEDQIIRDFLFDYSRYKRTRSEYKDAQVAVDQRIPLYISRFRLLAQRMTQKQLADALEFDHTYISKIENGHQSPSSEFLDKFAEFVHKWGESHA